MARWIDERFLTEELFLKPQLKLPEDIYEMYM